MANRFRLKPENSCQNTPLSKTKHPVEASCRQPAYLDELAKLRAALAVSFDQNDMLRARVAELEALLVEAHMIIEEKTDAHLQLMERTQRGTAGRGKRNRSM